MGVKKPIDRTRRRLWPSSSMALREHEDKEGHFKLFKEQLLVLFIFCCFLVFDFFDFYSNFYFFPSACIRFILLFFSLVS